MVFTVFKYSGVQCLLCVSAAAAWARQWQTACEVRDRTYFCSIYSNKNPALYEAWKVKAHLEIILFVLFWNAFETECIKLKSFMYVYVTVDSAKSLHITMWNGSFPPAITQFCCVSESGGLLFPV